MTTGRKNATMKPLVGIGLLGLVLFGACGGSNVIEPFDPLIEMLEYEERTIRFRYMDEDGLPISAASIRLMVQPNAEAGNGAFLSTHAAVTDADGVASVRLKAREEAAFLIQADADDAASPARMNVSVAKDSGGRIDVSVYQASAVAVVEAEILLVDDLECANFDEFEPPPASDDGVNTRQTVPIEPGKASNVVFRGLKPAKSYTVAAIGRAGNQVVARGCREGLYITEEMIDEKRSKSVTVDLEDRLVTPVGSELSVITKFKNNIGLTGIAGLMKSMAGTSGGNGPADYIMNQLMVYANRDDGLRQIMTIFRQRIAQEIAGQDGPAQGQRLLSAAKALASVEDVQLHSRISIRDEDDEGVITDELNVKHRMHKFTAVMLNNAGQMVRRDFPLASLADPRLTDRRRVFGSSALKLEDTAVMRVNDAARVSISPHTMSLPIADAVLGQILFDHFGDYKLDRIVGSMVYCDRAGQLVNDLAQQMGLYSWQLGDNFLLNLLEAVGKGAMYISIGGTVTTICQEEVKKVLAEAQRRTEEELKAFRSDQYIVLEGSADMMMLSDGVTIGWLKNGNWTGVGTFEAKRD